jgi:imidazolonepropionase
LPKEKQRLNAVSSSHSFVNFKQICALILKIIENPPKMSKLLIKNIRQLLMVEDQPKPFYAGKEMAQMPVLENAWLAVENDLIVDFGPMAEWPGISDWTDLEIIDADGKIVLPGWCDSHTHLIFAASREKEFVGRIQGQTYEEIAANGGGIINSALRLQALSEDELFVNAHQRLIKMMAQGTTTLEVKSGYGLTVKDEIKMLRVAARLKEVSPIPIKTTFLGAHAYPVAFKQNHEPYLQQIIHEMIPAIAAEGLADYCDVFCDRGFFSQEETERILEAGLKHGLKPKIHANELDYSGGIQAGVKFNAVSVDHLECTGDAEIEALLNSRTMPTLLPGTAFFLQLHYPPARKMIDAGLPIALASDFNPGSCPSFNMKLILTLACTHMKMLPSETIVAATINGARALELEASHGSIARGKAANLIITEELSSYECLPYFFGQDLVDTVIINGKIFTHE